MTCPQGAAQVAFLYNLFLIQPPTASSQSFYDPKLLYEQYGRWVKKKAVDFETFQEIVTFLRKNNTVKLDKYSLILSLKSFPYFLNSLIGFAARQPYIHDLLAQFSFNTSDFHFVVTAHFSTFFFPFWLAQFYWNCECVLITFLFPGGKTIDFYKFAMHYEDLLQNSGINQRDITPYSAMHPLYPNTMKTDPFLTPVSVRSTDLALQDLLELRPNRALYEEFYSMIHLRSHKLEAFFTNFFDTYFHLDAPLQYIEAHRWQSVHTHVSEMLNNNRVQIAKFLSVALPIQRILPSVLHTHRILIIFTSYTNLHPEYLLQDPFLQGIFQWGLLACQYQTTNLLSIVLLEYEIPISIFENPKSNFNRFWTDCWRRYMNRLQITIEPIISAQYAGIPSVFADHHLLIRSLSIKNLSDCDFCLNPNEITYNYMESLEGIDVPQADLHQYLIEADEENPPPEHLRYLPLWWREWCRPEFFLMTLGSLRLLFLIQKDEVWSKYQRQIVNFCRQFPGMTMTETPSFLLLELHIIGVVRETAAFVIFQFADINLAFEVILPVDARMFSSKMLQKLLLHSRQEYPLQLISREWVEEPLFHFENHQNLYSFIDRLRLHSILRQLFRTYRQRLDMAVWRQCLEYIDTAFTTPLSPDDDLVLYRHLEDIILEPRKE